MNEEFSHEGRRIRDVYAGYDGRRDRWDHANPGNAAIEQERLDVIWAALLRWRSRPLSELRLLDVGCGEGLVLAELSARGLDLTRAVGVDLLEDRLDAARQRLPRTRIERQDATRLSEANGSFDAVALFTVLSSVLAPDVRRVIAGEVRRVLRPGGLVLHYDMRVPNPQNPNVRPVGRSELARLFPGCTVDVRPVTVVPQLARRLGRQTDRLYPLLSRTRVLCTHLAGIVVTPG